MNYPTLLIVALLALVGCKRRSCIPPGDICVKVDRSWTSFADTAVVVTRYLQGSNWMHPFDSTINVLYIEPNNHAPHLTYVGCDFTQGLEYKITFLPSGTRRLISGIVVKNKKIPRSPFGGEVGNTFCGWNYTLDGKVVQVSSIYDDEGNHSGNSTIELNK